MRKNLACRAGIRLGLVLATLALNWAGIQTARAQNWVNDISLKTARWNHTATLLTNGLVLVAGGEIFNDSTNGFFIGTNSAELYNPAVGASTLTASMSVSHWGGSATLLTNGQVLVAAGRNNGGGVVASAELFDPNSQTWTNTGSLHTERTGYTATLLANGQVLVVGGQNFQAVDQSSAELYDPVSGAWSNTTAVGYATDSAAAVLLPNGKVLYCGGGDGQGGELTNAVLYNPTNATWVNTGPMQSARAGHVLTLLANGQVLAIGGGNSTELYDPTTGTWTNAASMNDGRTYPSAALLPNGQVLVVGGDPGQMDTELYNPTNNTWTFAASLHTGRFLNTITPLGDGQVVVTGGNAGTIGYYNGPAISSVETYAGHAISVNHTLVAHYPFDAPLDYGPFAGQLLMDTSGNGYNIDGPSSDDGTYPTVTGTSIAGGSAIQFDGDNWYELPTNLLTTIAGTYSISLWLKTTQVSGADGDDGFDDPAIVWAGGVGDNYFDSEPMTLTGNKLGFFTGGDATTLHSVSNINSGAFTHIVVTRDQPTGTKKIYINGVLDSTGIGVTNFLSDSTDLVLGESFYNGGVAGIVDDVQFYSGLLTDSDVAFLHANPGSVAPLGAPAPTLDVALNVTNLDFTTYDDVFWFAETDVTHDRDAAAQSGAMTDNQASALETTVTGPGTLTFWWKSVSDDESYNLQFQINGAQQNGISGQTDWTQQTYTLDAGTQRLTWLATTGDGSSLSDAGYVDQVTFTPIPLPGMWTLTGSMSVPRIGHTATFLTNGLVLVAVGTDNTNTFASAELYNPATGKWTPTTHSMTNARTAHTATLLTNGLVLVAGGNGTYTILNSAELYNPANGTRRATGSLHEQRAAQTATLLENGKVLVEGGNGTNAYPNDILASTEVYDPVTELWATNNPMFTNRYSHTATLLSGSGKVLIAGGQNNSTFIVTGETELFDPATGNWGTNGYMTSPLAYHAATELPGGKVLVTGGDFDEGSFGGISLVPSPFAELYDPGTQLWTSTTQMQALHDLHTATLLNNGLVLVAGQSESSSSFTNDTAELYDPVAQTWTVAAAMNFPRRGHTATLLPNGFVLAVGGGIFGAASTSAELYSSTIGVTSGPIVLVNETVLAGGAFQFSWTNTPGSANVVLSTTNLTTPAASWSTLGNGTEISSGHFQFSDPSPGGTTRFLS